MYSQAAECMVHHLAHESGTSHSSGVDEVFNFVVRGLNPKDVEYLKHWEHLINLEAIATQQRAQQRTSDSYDSEYSKKQLRGLTFVNCVKIAEPVHSENFLLTLSLRGGTLVSDEAVDSNQDYQLGDRLQVSVDINSAVADRIFFNGSSAGGNSAVPAAADHRHPTAATATSAAGTATATSTAVGDIEDLGSVTTARYPVIAASSQRAMTTEMNICMGKLHTKEVLDGDQSSLIQLELEGKPYTLFQLMQCFPDACAMNQFLTFRIAKDDLSVNITTMRYVTELMMYRCDRLTS